MSGHCHAHNKSRGYWSRMCRQPTVVKTAHLAATGRVNDTPQEEGWLR